MSNYNDKLRFAMTPSGYKAGTLYSQFPNVSESDFQVVRNSIGTRVNKDGLIEVMDANVPRLDYSDGGCPKLLTEASSTNIVPFSNDFTKFSVFSTTSFQNVFGISPDGGLNANRFLFPQGSTFSQFTYPTNELVVGQTYTQSMYVKKTEESNYFDLVFGGDTFKPTNEWQRLETQFTATAINQNLLLTYVSSVPSGQINEIYVYGAQVETSDSITSYIPTNGVAVIRQADQVTNAGNSSTFNSNSGVLFADVKTSQKVVFGDGAYRLNDSNGSNYIGFTLSSFYNGYSTSFVRNNTLITTPIIQNVGIDIQHRVAIRYNNQSFNIFIDGLSYGLTSGDFSLPSNTINEIELVTTKNLTKSIQHYDYLTDAEMEQLTGYDSYSAMTSQFNFNVL